MKQILLCFLLVFFISCNKENKNKPEIKTDTIPKNTASEIQETKVDTFQKVDLGYADQYDKLPKLAVDTTSETEFEQLKAKNYLDKVNAEQIGDFFYIQTENKKQKFKKYKDYGGEESWSGYDLLGYYANLKLFVITESSTSEHMGFSELFLLDYTNDYRYNIVSFGDGRVELPIPSINNKYLVYYYNSVYESQNCDIGVLKINEKTNPKNYLTEAASYHSNEFKIEKIIWRTDDVFYIKAYKEVDNKNLYSYYKVQIN